jgi:hypothetical protein
LKRDGAGTPVPAAEARDPRPTDYRRTRAAGARDDIRDANHDTLYAAYVPPPAIAETLALVADDVQRPQVPARGQPDRPVLDRRRTRYDPKPEILAGEYALPAIRRVS